MISKSSYEAVSRQWRSKNDDSHDFLVVRNDSVFRAGFSGSSVFESDFRKARDLKNVFLERHAGMVIEDVFDEIQASNMSKLGDDGKPVLRDDGKILKGPGYFRPDLSKFIKIDGGES